jgi:hypothetical protein
MSAEQKKLSFDKIPWGSFDLNPQDDEIATTTLAVVPVPVMVLVLVLVLRVLVPMLVPTLIRRQVLLPGWTWGWNEHFG